VNDDLVTHVSEIYGRFPYPSPLEHGLGLRELRNLLTIFSRENGYRLDGKSVLDVGTGTGHRLVEAAASFPEARFVAVDVSEEPLNIARRVAAHEGVGNVEFGLFDVMQEGGSLGVFDVVLAMGVLHHLPDPARGLRNLVRHVAEDGIVFLYVYGAQGSGERMRRKQIISLLAGSRSPFDERIELVKSLGFDTTDYGWNLGAGDERSRDVLIVDAYLNVKETLFDADGLFELFTGSGLERFTIFGLTHEDRGYLFETRLTGASRGIALTTTVADKLPTPAAQEAYERLSTQDRYRLLDLLYQPNGYTLLGLTSGAIDRLPADGRILANTLPAGRRRS